MSLRTFCSACGAAYDLPEHFAGKNVRCKKCGQVFRVAPPQPPEEELLDAVVIDDPDAAIAADKARPGSRPGQVPPRRSPVRREADEPSQPAKKKGGLGVGCILGIVAGVLGLVVLACGGGLAIVVVAAMSVTPATTWTSSTGVASIPVPKPPPVPGPGQLPDIAEIRDGRFAQPPKSNVPTSYLHAVSSKGDYIGGGETLKYDNAQLVVTGTGQMVSVAIDDWTVQFSAPRGQVLQVGEHNNAKRYPFNDNFPGLNFSGHGRGCNQVGGKFVVWEFEANGNQINRLAVDFIHRCEGTMPPLYGRVRYNSSFQ